MNPHKYLSNVAKRKIWQNVAIQLSVNICISNWHFRERYLYEVVTFLVGKQQHAFQCPSDYSFIRCWHTNANATHRTFNLNSMCVRWFKKQYKQLRTRGKLYGHCGDVSLSDLSAWNVNVSVLYEYVAGLFNCVAHWTCALYKRMRVVTENDENRLISICSSCQVCRMVEFGVAWHREQVSCNVSFLAIIIANLLNVFLFIY